jgi:hypothetical protein
MRARYTDPATGRFISEDPCKQGGNWLAYCGNNPVCATDPTGKFFLFEILLGAADGVSTDEVNAACAQRFENWSENKLFEIFCNWAEKFGQEWSEDFAADFESDAWGNAHWENDNFTIAGEDGEWRIRLDFSGHDGTEPHFNIDNKFTGSGANSWGNHAGISSVL